jgi:hypothetical protein
MSKLRVVQWSTGGVGRLAAALTGSGLAQASDLIGEAGAVLRPADNYGGRMAFRWIAPVALIVALFFALMFMADRKKGGYRAEKLH